MKFKNEISINSKEVGSKRTFIIAEIGSNHNQDINQAFELIDLAIECGADAVKFQSIIPNKLYNLKDLEPQNIDILEKIKFQEEWYPKISRFCKVKGILFFSAPTYLEAVDILIQNDVKLMKIASPQTYGFPQLIRKIGESGLPTLMSTGYCTYLEIERAVNVFKQTGNQNLVLLHCISEYPTLPKNVNLNFINQLSSIFRVIVGFSDHTLGFHTALAAVAKGAKVIEKHLTISRELEGLDHHFAIEPQEFKEMINNIRDIEENLGVVNKQKLTKFEFDFRKELEMKMCAKKDIEMGEEINIDKIYYLRNKLELGISAWEEQNIIGKKAKIKIIKDEFLEYSKIN